MAILCMCRAVYLHDAPTREHVSCAELDRFHSDYDSLGLPSTPPCFDRLSSTGKHWFCIYQQSGISQRSCSGALSRVMSHYRHRSNRTFAQLSSMSRTTIPRELKHPSANQVNRKMPGVFYSVAKLMQIKWE